MADIDAARELLRDGATVALREAREETGIDGLVFHPSAPRPLDVDVHPIPARLDEPAHLHHRHRRVVPAYELAVRFADGLQ